MLVMTSMSKGANLPVPVTALRAVLGWNPGAGGPDVDASALLLTAAGKVRSDADFVFYNQPDARLRRRQLRRQAARQRHGHRRPAPPGGRHRTGRHRASADGGTFGRCRGCTCACSSRRPGAEVARFDITDADQRDGVRVRGAYLRNGTWKFRAVGQGYASVWAGLATDFGISVDDATGTGPPAPPAPAPASRTAPPAPGTFPDLLVQLAGRRPCLGAPRPRPRLRPAAAAPWVGPPVPVAARRQCRRPPAAGRQRAAAGGISLKKQSQVRLEKKLSDRGDTKLLSLTKKAAVSLEKKGLGEHTARVAICLDISGSMSPLYRSGKIQALAERVLALGMRFDDDGEIDCFLFGKDGYAPGPMSLDNYASYVPTCSGRTRSRARPTTARRSSCCASTTSARPPGAARRIPTSRCTSCSSPTARRWTRT
jgi:stress response protein SCP2